MTQKSLPQQGHIQDALSPDAGPYSAARWAEIWSAIFTASPDHGPIGETGDTTLEVSLDAPLGLDVAAGEAMVGGRVFQSDAIMSFALTPPVSNTRIDVVVVVQNESASTVTTGIASSGALVFPSDLTDYDGVASIPPYSSRLAVLTGVAAPSPVAPTLDQNPDLLHMIPLAQVTLSTSAITDVADARVYTRSMAGSTVYIPEYYNDLVKNVYSGRARIIPISTEITIAAGQYQGILSFSGEANPTLDVEKYATFVTVTVDDFDLILPEGGSLRGAVAVIGGYPDPTHIEFHVYRGGYVDLAGVAQPVNPSAKGYNMHYYLTQLLDVAPSALYGRLPEGV